MIRRGYLAGSVKQKAGHLLDHVACNQVSSGIALSCAITFGLWTVSAGSQAVLIGAIVARQLYCESQEGRENCRQDTSVLKVSVFRCLRRLQDNDPSCMRSSYPK